jgi:DnaA family protein
MHGWKTIVNSTRGQLPLQFPFNDQQSLENFQSGVNAELLTRLEQVLAPSPVFSSLALWGGSGSGVTHLLNAACHRVGARGGRVALLPLGELAADADMLQGLERWDLVALDDVESWFGSARLEAALMGLYEEMAGGNGTLLLGARRPAAACTFALPDWRSRCAALLAYQVLPLDDAGKGRLLRAHAAARGLELSDPVLKFWLARSERSVSGLLAQLELVDQAALRAQRAITVPLLKAALEL